MGAGKIALVLSALVGAAGVGIGIAEIYQRNATANPPQTVATPTSPPPSGNIASGSREVSAEIGRMWVTSDRLELRSCPSSSCGLASRLYFREAVDVVEVKSGWGRVSRYNDAFCSGGRTSDLEDNTACTSENGFIEGKYAQWAELAHLSPARPADPGANAKGISKLVAQSDDFRLYELAFVKAAQQMIERGTCTEADFLDMGGWMSSPDKPFVYFTYCGGMTKSNRYYLDVKSGRVFQ